MQSLHPVNKAQKIREYLIKLGTYFHSHIKEGNKKTQWLAIYNYTTQRHHSLKFVIPKAVAEEASMGILRKFR